MKTLAAFLSMGISLAFAAEPLTHKATVPLPGVEGRFDHFAVDTNGNRVFVAALGNNTVEVIDRATAKRVQTITGQHKPCGIVFLSEANQIVIANGATEP
jgi:YVTN family beta-propeller protein